MLFIVLRVDRDVVMRAISDRTNRNRLQCTATADGKKVRLAVALYNDDYCVDCYSAKGVKENPGKTRVGQPVSNIREWPLDRDHGACKLLAGITINYRLWRRWRIGKYRYYYNTKRRSHETKLDGKKKKKKI